MLISVDPNDMIHLRFLYQLQQERYKYPHINIPGMAQSLCPTWKEHCDFVKSKPYKYYCIYYNEKNILVASVYMKQNNEIGILVLHKFWGNNFGQQCLTEFIKRAQHFEDTFTATVNINNQPSNNLFKKLGFEHVGNVYLKRP